MSYEVNPEFNGGGMAAVEEQHNGEYFDEYEAAFGEFDFESLGIDPNAPTEAKPGSAEKVMTLAARYAAGLPLWHDEDCYDHGPGLQFLEGLGAAAAELDEE